MTGHKKTGAGRRTPRYQTARWCNAERPLRKGRWARPGAGKRGGLRIIYYWVPGEQAFYMLYVYAKNEQGDLIRAQARSLGQLVREEFR